jgi:hypothetical protein
MAFITNQWMKGSLWAARSHTPVQTELRWEDIAESWSRDNSLQVAFRLVKADGNYQSVFLTIDDLALLLPKLAGVADARTKTGVALATLDTLSPAILFSALAKRFSSKAQQP